VTGRKRHIVVDTLGMLLAVTVHAADVQDRDGAKLVLAKLGDRFPRLWVIWVDGGYAGKLLVWALATLGLVLDVVKRPGAAKGFAVLPKRWIVERTFAWLGRSRRLSKDYEALPETSEAWIRIAMIQLMLKRLAPGTYTSQTGSQSTGRREDRRGDRCFCQLSSVDGPAMVGLDSG